MSKNLFFILLALLVTAGINAQPPHPPPPPNDTSFKKTINAIGNLFKKKKKDTTVVNTAAPATTTTNATNNTSLISTGLKPGDMVATVKYIDADRIFDFNAGSARIIKGTSTALIDSAGNYIYPYNTYDFAALFVAGPNGYVVHYNGIYQYNNTNHQWGGYMNAKGKILFKTGLNTGVVDFTENGRLIKLNTSSPSGVTYTYFTPEGKTYTTSQLIENIIDGIGILRVKNGTNWAYLYKKLSGEMVASYFDDAAPFSNGMARVGKKDEFGQLKYGYINMQGKLVVPFLFSEVPDDFTGNFAKVKPKDKSAFEYAFINKVGEVVFKQTLTDISKYGTFGDFTNYGLAFSDKYLMDTTFKIIPKTDFFKAFGIPADSWFVQPGVFTDGETNPKLVYSTRTARSQYTQQPLYGFINLATKKVVIPVFDFINTNGLYFDPISHLAYAKVCLGRDNKNVPVYREGYINEDGQFVMVRGDGSKW